MTAPYVKGLRGQYTIWETLEYGLGLVRLCSARGSIVMKKPALLAVLVVLCASGAYGERVDLMPGPAGRPVIVVPAGWSGGEAYQGHRILSTTLEQITSVKPVMVKESAAKPAPGQIWLDGCERSKNLFANQLKGLDNDGFLVAVKDGNLFILGPGTITGHGTLNGVIDFLKRDLGCRWYMPGELGSVIPRRADLDLDVTPRRIEPDFRARIFYLKEYSWMRGDTERFLYANRRHIRLRYHHNMHRVLPPSKFAKDHPEWYCEIDGKRRAPKRDTTSAWQPCMTNAGGVKAAAQTIVETFRKNARLTSVSIGVNDGAGYCQCKACRAKYLDGEQKDICGQYGRLYFEWANQVAALVAKEFPDRLLGCLSYGGVYVPPKGLEMHPTIVPMAVMPTYTDRNPKEREAHDRRAKLLSERCAKWGVYDWYYGAGMVFPLPIHHLLQERLQHYHKLGARAIYYEGYPNWALDGHKYALMNDLLWDVNMDVDAWLADFYAKFFGAAAEPMKRYDALWEKAWLAGAGIEKINPHGEGTYAHIKPDTYEQARALLDEALEKADSLIVRQRVQFYAAGLRGSEILVKRQWLAQRAQDAVAKKVFANAFVALADLQSPEFDYNRYYREFLKPLPLQAMLEPSFRLDMMSAGAMAAQFKLLQSLEAELGRPGSLRGDDPTGRAKVQDVLAGLTKGRAASPDELVLREKLRDMLGRVATARRTPKAPVIDGALDEDCWRNAYPLGQFFKFTTVEPSKYATEARMAYDAENLYVAFVAHQDRKTLWQESSGLRDGRIWCDDAVELFMNRPDAAGKEYVQFIINAWGSVYDHYAGDKKFNPDIKLKSVIHDDRFVVELAVPWKALPRMKPADRVFRINIQRGKRQRGGYEEVSNWFPGAEGPSNLNARGWLVLVP